MGLRVKEMETVIPSDAVEHDFERLFVGEAAAVWRTIYAFTGGRNEIAEEAVAEAFARAFAYRRGIRDPLAWIYRTAFRLAKEELRRERRPVPSEQPSGDEPAGVGALIHALRELSPHQRAAIVLRYEVDLPVAEIARRMGIAAPTVRVHLLRGRRRLRLLLGTEEVEDA
jgi:RNA polymerase sigma-70 factor (ECF subfamily)